MGKPRRVEVVIGHNVRKMRERSGLSQAELGEKLGAILGASWSRSTVSQAESGKRAFVAAELVALSVVFGCGIQTLFRHNSDDSVEISDVYSLSGHQLDSLTLSINDPMIMRAFALVRQILSGQARLQESLADMLNESRLITDEAMKTLTFSHPSELKQESEDATGPNIDVADLDEAMWGPAIRRGLFDDGAQA